MCYLIYQYVADSLIHHFGHQVLIHHSWSFRSFEGEYPKCRLYALEKLESSVKPTSNATCVIGMLLCLSNSEAFSIRILSIRSKGFFPVNLLNFLVKLLRCIGIRSAKSLTVKSWLDKLASIILMTESMNPSSLFIPSGISDCFHWVDSIAECRADS